MHVGLEDGEINLDSPELACLAGFARKWHTMKLIRSSRALLLSAWLVTCHEVPSTYLSSVRSLELSSGPRLWPVMIASKID